MQVIFNPAANNFQLGKERTKFMEKISQLSQDYELVETIVPGDARTIAKEIAINKEHDIVVSAGGDGTAHNIIMGFFDSGIPVIDFPKIAVLPVGTSNDFCKTIGVPLDLDEAIEVINGENVSQTNTILCQGDDQLPHHNINLGQVGLISAISYGASVEREKPIFPFNIPPFSLFSKGPRRYTLIALKYILWKYSNIPTKMVIDNQEEREIDLTFFAFGVGKEMAHYPFCPHAELYGDTFAIGLGKNLSKLNKLKLIGQLKKENYKNVELLEAKKVVLELEEPISGDADGECFAVKATKFSFELQKKMVKVLVP
ncbi:MAG: diacylglycerol/lipid kinase family protein [Candidatus Kariarchaeaceae archaeon]